MAGAAVVVVEESDVEVEPELLLELSVELVEPEELSVEVDDVEVAGGVGAVALESPDVPRSIESSETPERSASCWS